MGICNCINKNENIDKGQLNLDINKSNKLDFVEDFEIKNNDDVLDKNFISNDYLSISKELASEDGCKLLLLHDDKLIREDEKKIIKFTIYNTIELYNKLINLDEYKLLYAKDNETLVFKIINNGWELEKNFNLTFHRYIMDISELSNIDLSSITLLMNEPEYLNKWDKTFKKYQVLHSSTNTNSKVLYKIFNSLIPFASARDLLEKNIKFQVKNRLFSLSTSTNDDYSHGITPSTDIIRMKNYLSLFSFYIRKYNDRRQIVFFGFNQIDIKMNVPDMLKNSTLPLQTKSYYNNLYKALKLYNTKGKEEFLK